MGPICITPPSSPPSTNTTPIGKKKDAKVCQCQQLVGFGGIFNVPFVTSSLLTAIITRYHLASDHHRSRTEGSGSVGRAPPNIQFRVRTLRHPR